jgi:hypothetical protein
MHDPREIMIVGGFDSRHDPDYSWRPEGGISDGRRRLAVNRASLDFKSRFLQDIRGRPIDARVTSVDAFSSWVGRFPAL